MNDSIFSGCVTFFYSMAFQPKNEIMLCHTNFVYNLYVHLSCGTRSQIFGFSLRLILYFMCMQAARGLARLQFSAGLSEASLNPLVPKHRMHYQKTLIFHPDTSFGKSNRKQGLNLC